MTRPQPESTDRYLLHRIDLLERMLAEALFGAGLPYGAEEWGLTEAEEKVLSVLIQHDIATEQMLKDALYYKEGKRAPKSNLHDVILARLRKKVAPAGITIRNIYGTGYSMDRKSRERFRLRTYRAMATKGVL